MSHFNQCYYDNLIQPPKFVVGGLQYEVIMGSVAYGVSTDTSDMDIYGFCIPPKDYIFPHLSGHIQGFGKKHQGFDQFIQHHVMNKNKTKEYDFQIYNIVKYFQLCMENNPNMIDSLFVPYNCISSTHKIGNMVRDERKIFLHRGAWHKFKGYAFSELSKIRNKKILSFVKFCKENNIDVSITLSDVENLNLADDKKNELTALLKIVEKDGIKTKRLKLVEKYGFDVKFSYHVVRLLNEVEQILNEGDLDLQRNNDQLKAIRNGECTLNQIEDYFNFKEKELEKLYNNSKLQYFPDEDRIKQLLINCLEEYYGNLENCIVSVDKVQIAINEIKDVINKYNL
jgi:predicted nucleotidyltransferase